MAGLRFTAQYIGLRGLTYPCAIAHLSAIILMAATRALVRRRLSDSPPNIPSFQGHELDFLAHLSVFNQNFANDGPFTDDKHDLVCRWGVKTPDTCKEIEEQIGQDSENDICAESVKRESEASEKLLLVRKRLGNLSRWKTQASPSALSVAKSVEAFIKIFFPVTPKNSQKKVEIDWPLETWRQEENLEEKAGIYQNTH